MDGKRRKWTKSECRICISLYKFGCFRASSKTPETYLDAHEDAGLEIVRNGMTFGDMPVWEMRFVTKVMFEVEIAEELCEEQ